MHVVIFSCKTCRYQISVEIKKGTREVKCSHCKFRTIAIIQWPNNQSMPNIQTTGSDIVHWTER